MTAHFYDSHTDHSILYHDGYILISAPPLTRHHGGRPGSSGRRFRQVSLRQTFTSDQLTYCSHSTLSEAEIPVKLRCSMCTKLAINAFKLQCCDQAVCQDCQASLPEACPVCSHSPLGPDMIKPNKTLRLTIRAFLRNEEKKRAAAAEAAAQSIPEPSETPVQQLESAPSQQQDAVESDQAPAEVLHEGNNAQVEASIGEHVPQVTDPLDQVEQVWLYDACLLLILKLTDCVRRCQSSPQMASLTRTKQTRPPGSRETLSPRQTKASSRPPSKVEMTRLQDTIKMANHRTNLDRTLRNRISRTWTGTPLTDLTP